ncbi:sensor histidine kinase [Paenibacillus psychroresistens]|nr:sensor histidine kinase [Paenibacillus psychroresistens]
MKSIAYITDYYRRIKSQSNKIVSKLFVTYFIIILIAIISTGITSYNYASKSIEKKVMSASTEVVAQIQKNLDLNLVQIRNTIIMPYYNENLLNGLDDYKEMNEAQQASYERMLYDFFSRSYYVPKRPDIVDVFMFNEVGDPLFSSKKVNPDSLKQLYNYGSWLQRTIDYDGRVYFESAYPDMVSDEKRMLFSASILVKGFGTQGVVKAEYNFSAITDIFKDFDMGKGSKLVLVDEDGKIIYSTGDDPITSEFNPEINLQLSEAKGSLWLDYGSNKNLIAYTKLTMSDWKVISIVPEAEVFDASIHIRNATIIIATVALLVTSILSLLFASWITKPILKIFKSVEKVKLGDLDVRINWKRTDELGKIALNFNTMVEEIDNLIKSKYIYQIKLKEAEINFLQSQINPHFLYNTLYTIKAKADYHQNRDISAMVTSLAEMFRYSIKNPNGFVTVDREVGNIIDYLTIQKERFGEKIDYEIVIGDEVRSEIILKLIMQPIVENAVYHGLERKKGKGLVLIEGTMDQEHLYITITDDGVGMDQESLDKLRYSLKESEKDLSFDQSIGLINVHTRLVLCYGNEYGLRIESHKNLGSKVMIRIPRDHAAIKNNINGGITNV